MFLDRGIFVFTPLNMNTEGWARRGAQHAGGAPGTAILLAHQAVTPAVALRDRGRLLGVLLRDGMPPAQEIGPEVAIRHPHTPQNFRDI